MLGVHANEAGLACVFEVDDRSFRLGDHGRYPALKDPRNPRWYVKFKLKSIFAALTCFCILLSLNAIPGRSNLVIRFYEFPGAYKVRVTSYGWPYTFSNGYSAYDLPSKLPEGLTRQDIEAGFGDHQFRLFDNLIIISIGSLLAFLVFELAFRHWPEPPSSGQRAG